MLSGCFPFFFIIDERRISPPTQWRLWEKKKLDNCCDGCCCCSSNTIASDACHMLCVSQVYGSHTDFRRSTAFYSRCCTRWTERVSCLRFPRQAEIDPYFSSGGVRLSSRFARTLAENARVYTRVARITIYRVCSFACVRGARHHAYTLDRETLNSVIILLRRASDITWLYALSKLKNEQGPLEDYVSTLLEWRWINFDHKTKFHNP